ncbi:hypothetical protein JCM11251_002902 [Rhodosporidiobolus azoricus]
MSCTEGLRSASTSFVWGKGLPQQKGAKRAVKPSLHVVLRSASFAQRFPPAVAEEAFLPASDSQPHSLNSVVLPFPGESDANVADKYALITAPPRQTLDSATRSSRAEQRQDCQSEREGGRGSSNLGKLKSDCVSEKPSCSVSSSDRRQWLQRQQDKYVQVVEELGTAQERERRALRELKEVRTAKEEAEAKLGKLEEEKEAVAREREQLARAKERLAEELEREKKWMARKQEYLAEDLEGLKQQLRRSLEREQDMKKIAMMALDHQARQCRRALA